MSIIIGADFVPTDSNREMFQRGDIDSLFGNALNNILMGADYRIFNLEIPLTNTMMPIKKCGPNLIASPDNISGYKTAGVDLFTLANNHILDQGEQGLYSTLQTLEKNGFHYVGVGDRLEKASAPFFFDSSGHTFGVYACVEHEFTVAEVAKPGANPFDPLYSLDHIKKAKNNCDYLIVLYHGGKEHYRYPSPYLQKVCRRIVECGADLVLCQHSHCIGCEEIYKEARILYGQGNFLFDHSNNECWQTGLLVNITDNLQVDYIPLVKNENVVRLAEGQVKSDVINALKRRSDEARRFC